MAVGYAYNKSLNVVPRFARHWTASVGAWLRHFMRRLPLPLSSMLGISERDVEVTSNKREWHGAHHFWSFRPQAFRWSGEMICGINILPIAMDMRAWMLRRGQLSLMPDQEAPENRGGFTNPYTKNGVTLSLLMAGVINSARTLGTNDMDAPKYQPMKRDEVLFHWLFCRMDMETQAVGLMPFYYI